MHAHCVLIITRKPS